MYGPNKEKLCLLMSMSSLHGISNENMEFPMALKIECSFNNDRSIRVLLFYFQINSFTWQSHTPHCNRTSIVVIHYKLNSSKLFLENSTDYLEKYQHCRMFRCLEYRNYGKSVCISACYGSLTCRL